MRSLYTLNSIDNNKNIERISPVWNSKGVRETLLFGKFPPKICMKMKEIGLGARVPASPLGSAN